MTTDCISIFNLVDLRCSRNDDNSNKHCDGVTTKKRVWLHQKEWTQWAGSEGWDAGAVTEMGLMIKVIGDV